MLTQEEIKIRIEEIQSAALNEVAKKQMHRLQQAFGNAKYEAVINKSQFCNENNGMTDYGKNTVVQK